MDTKAIAAKVFSDARTLIQKDLEALPEEAFSQSFGEATRTVADIIFEVNMVNDHIGMVLRGEEPFEWPEGGWVKAPEDFRAKQTVCEAFDRSSQKVVEMIEAFSQEQIESKVQTERGETTVFQRIQFMALHMWYHSGQFNYIQTLRGDDDWHW